MALLKEDDYRDHLSTVDEEGKRVWVYPKKPSGRFYQWRTYISWVLLVFLFGMYASHPARYHRKVTSSPLPPLPGTGYSVASFFHPWL